MNTHKNLKLEEIFDLALQNQKKGNMRDAEILYNEILKKDPKQFTVYYNLGSIFNQLGEYQKSIPYYKKAIEINPEYAEGHNTLGSMYIQMDEKQKAINCFEIAIKINSNLFDPNNNLGVLLTEIKEFKKAKNCFEKAIEINPANKKVFYNIGNLYKELGEYQKSITYFDKAIEIDPNYVDAHNNLAGVYGLIGKLKNSVKHKREALINRSVINFETNKEENQKLLPATSEFFLELTNKCNFHCEFCPSDSQTRLQGYMDLSLVKKIFDEISEKKIITTVNLHLMGEPTLHPKLNDILDYAKSKNVKVALTTNGSTLVKKKIPKLLNSISGEIIASLMTPTKDSYKIRGDVGLSWDRYVDNFRLLIQEHLKKILRGDKIQYEIIFRVMVTNKKQIGAAKVLETSSDVLGNYKQWSDYTETVEKEIGLIPFNRQTIDEDEILSILEKDERVVNVNIQKNIRIQFWRAFTFANTRVSDEYKLVPTEQAQFCPHPFTDFGVLWNGDVSLCCLDYDGTLKVGNVNNHSIEDVMKNNDSKKLRASMYGLEKLHPTCIKCQSRPIDK